MKVPIGILYIFLCICDSSPFIIPDELPSLLSVIYSNIPTLKKGTDSRIGWGFRLGNRADFQVMVELGPQLNTQPLGNQGGDNTNKRNTLNNLANTLYAQRQQEKKHKEVKIVEQNPKSDGEKWLQTWSKKTLKPNDEENETQPLKPRPGIAIGEIDAKSVIPEDADEINDKKMQLFKQSLIANNHEMKTKNNKTSLEVDGGSSDNITLK